jgi:hypothetical protein
LGVSLAADMGHHRLPPDRQARARTQAHVFPHWK